MTLVPRWWADRGKEGSKRSGASAPLCVLCVCVMSEDCVVLQEKVAIMIIDIQSINTPHFNTFVFRACVESCACISEADKNGVQAREFADLTLLTFLHSIFHCFRIHLLIYVR